MRKNEYKLTFQLLIPRILFLFVYVKDFVNADFLKPGILVLFAHSLIVYIDLLSPFYSACLYLGYYLYMLGHTCDFVYIHMTTSWILFTQVCSHPGFVTCNKDSLTSGILFLFAHIQDFVYIGLVTPGIFVYIDMLTLWDLCLFAHTKDFVCICLL